MDSTTLAQFRSGTNAKHGAIGRSLAARAWRRWISNYRRWFGHWNYVFRADGPFLEDLRSACRLVRYDSVDAVPEHVINQIKADRGDQRWETDSLELGTNSTLWIAMVDGRVASTVFTREGKYYRNWFLPLRPTDVVVFRLRTHEDFRGRGLAVSLMRHAVAQTVPIGSNAYVDCRTYNKPSIRCIEKAGFVRVARMKTISRRWALGLE